MQQLPRCTLCVLASLLACLLAHWSFQAHATLNIACEYSSVKFKLHMSARELLTFNCLFSLHTLIYTRLLFLSFLIITHSCTHVRPSSFGDTHESRSWVLHITIAWVHETTEYHLVAHPEWTWLWSHNHISHMTAWGTNAHTNHMWSCVDYCSMLAQTSEPPFFD